LEVKPAALGSVGAFVGPAIAGGLLGVVLWKLTELIVPKYMELKRTYAAQAERQEQELGG